MNHDVDSIDIFFNGFEMDEDVKNGHYFKGYLKQSILAFMKNNSKESAYAVYTTFLDCYRMKVTGNKSLIDLLDALKAFEENASKLLDKQRDHYIHSVNVFVLGLIIYSNNIKYQNYVEEYIKRDVYEEKFTSHIEDFFFRWGIASMFHDIGYPVEITNNQIQKFMDLAVKTNEGISVGAFIAFENFSQLNCIVGHKFKDYKSDHLNNESVSLSKPIDLLAYSIHSAFEIDLNFILKELNNYLFNMQKKGFVDHGFYSAIMVLKWYGHIINQSGLNTEILYHPVLDAASAILLHNYYKNTLQKEPFFLGKLKAEKHPIAYLLILCDELQEWNREAYGVLDRQKVLASDCKISVTADRLDVHFITYKGTLDRTFSFRKKELFDKLLDIDDIFEESIHITSTTKTEQYIERIRIEDAPILPRPFLENIEQLAILIHQNYNKEQLNRNPEKKLDYPDWSSLPDDLKYSNVQQARNYFDKLKMMGYVALYRGDLDKEVFGFDDNQVEDLARHEHNRWYDERKSNGWTYAEIKNIKEKTSPYMVPYDQLSEEIKELDRDAVKNIFPLLHRLGLKIYKL